MNPQTLEALKQSIRHWHENATGKTQSCSRHDCALCTLYLNPIYIFCLKCPVYEKTKNVCCIGTPYEDAFRAKLSNSPKDFLQAAILERDFLISLLPTQEDRIAMRAELSIVEVDPVA